MRFSEKLKSTKSFCKHRLFEMWSIGNVVPNFKDGTSSRFPQCQLLSWLPSLTALVQVTAERHQKERNQRTSVTHTMSKDHPCSSSASPGYKIMGVLKEWRRRWHRAQRDGKICNAYGEGSEVRDKDVWLKPAASLSLVCTVSQWINISNTCLKCPQFLL